MIAFDYIHLEYSNYVAPFKGLLDYILYNGSCKRVSSAESFSHGDIVRDTAIPSKRFPSDHLAQVATLEFLG